MSAAECVQLSNGNAEMLKQRRCQHSSDAKDWLPLMLKSRNLSAACQSLNPVEWVLQHLRQPIDWFAAYL